MDRRSFLLSSAGTVLGVAGFSHIGGPTFAQEAPTLALQGDVFSFERLTEAMKARAAEPYNPPEDELPEAVAELTYDDHRAIRFRPEHALWRGEAPFEMQAFHPGWLFKHPAHIYVLDTQGRAKRAPFTTDDFVYDKPLGPERLAGVELPGMAGFRLHYPLNDPQVMDELVAFLGASYFRALGQGNAYGLSGRGLAVNTATSRGEEFPRFTDFWVETPTRQSEDIRLYAALESESVTGAYAFTITPGRATVMDVTARLFIRRDIERLGIAPMTSMFLFAENNRSSFDDFRGQVHDSDGLKIVRASGEELWRNLNNPSRLASSFFGETSPRAFGLYQRDRDFDNYQDAGASYERRPSLLVEPLDDWGKGWVHLVELPTELEVNDNIVAFWVPEGDIKAGQEHTFRYRLKWGALEEPTEQLARVTALRSGIGGVSGVENPDALRKFVVDFEGEVLNELADDAEVGVSLAVNRARVAHHTVSRVAANGAWRLVINFEPDGEEPVEFSAFLENDGKRLSETWVYQWRRDDAHT